VTDIARAARSPKTKNRWGKLTLKPVGKIHTEIQNSPVRETPTTPGA
jgi:hypothetical protein